MEPPTLTGLLCLLPSEFRQWGTVSITQKNIATTVNIPITITHNLDLVFATPGNIETSNAYAWILEANTSTLKVVSNVVGNVHWLKIDRN